MHLARTNNEVLRLAYNKAVTGYKFKLSVDLENTVRDLKSLTYVMSKSVDITLCTKPKELNKIIPNASDEIIKDISMFVNRTEREIGLIEYLKEYSTSGIRSGFTLLRKLTDMDITIDKFRDTIKDGIDPKANILVSNVHLVKGAEAGSVTLHWFKNPYELQEECVFIASRNVTVPMPETGVLTFEYIEKTHPKCTPYLQYLEEMYILYVATSRAKHTLKFNRCGEHDYWVY